MKARIEYADGSSGYRTIQMRNGQPVVERDHRTLVLREVKPGLVYQEIGASEYHARKPQRVVTPWWMQ